MSSRIKSGGCFIAAASASLPTRKRTHFMPLLPQHVFQQLQVGGIVIHDHDVALRQAPARLAAACFLQQSRQGHRIRTCRPAPAKRARIRHRRSRPPEGSAYPGVSCCRSKSRSRSSSTSSRGSLPESSALKGSTASVGWLPSVLRDLFVIVGNVSEECAIFSSSSSSRQGFARKSSAPL